MSEFQRHKSGTIVLEKTKEGGFLKWYFQDNRWLQGQGWENAWITAEKNEEFERVNTLEEAQNPKLPQKLVPAEEPEPKVEGPKKGK